MEAIDITIKDRRKAGVRPASKRSPRTDMTPMVDLGFLLISFFVMTTELSKPRLASLNMPADGPPTSLGKSEALTVLIGSVNSVYYYEGSWEQAVAEERIKKTNLSAEGLRRVIIEKKKWMDTNKTGEASSGLMLLIKPTEMADYKQVVDVLDETMINNVKKYAIVKTEKEELGWLKQHQ